MRENNLYLLDFSAGNIVRIDAKTKQPTVYLTPTPNSHPRRGRVDDQGRLWFAEYFGNAIGMLDPKTGKIEEWKVPTPWSSPYDAVPDRNGDAWTGSMNTDRVARLDIKTGQYTEYPLPRPTNIRRVFVDDSKKPGHALDRQQPRRLDRQGRAAGLMTVRHSLNSSILKVRAQRASKDAAQAPRPSSFAARCASRASDDATSTSPPPPPAA